MIRFLLNQQEVSLSSVDADLTLLDYIREQRRLSGTKEGCAAGDCGACTLVLAEPNAKADGLFYRTVNSCITLMSAVHGKQLITVEHLSDNNMLHPVQQALVDHHGSQCGFCTPGFVMSMFALYHQNAQPNRDDVLNALSGNLCRCTGYKPIIDATLAVCAQAPDDQFSRKESETLKQLLSFTTGTQGTPNLIMPTDRKALAHAKAQHPDAQLVAGSTDLSLQFTQQLKKGATLISLNAMSELKTCTTNEHSITIGAALPLNDAMPTLLKHFPTLAELLTRFASLPIRNQATMGGNVANASPIGDLPPVLLALDAKLHLDNGTEKRIVPIREFFTGYRQTQLASDEWLAHIEIPKLNPEQKLAAFKISKRMEDDISAVCAVFKLTLSDGTIEQVETGFGGVAATPVQCNGLADALIGKAWSDKSCVALGKNILENAFSPIDDVRASANYRNTVLANLWHRFWLENQTNNTIQTRVVSHA